MASSDSNNQSKIQAFLEFMYDSKNGTVMGRTGLSWAKIGVFYFFFYSCLAVFFAAMLALFFTTIDKDEPRLQGYDSLLKMNPGMSFEPQLDVETTLIRAESTKAQDVKDRLQNFMKVYKTQNLDQLKDCGDDDSADDDQGCRVPDIWTTQDANYQCQEKQDFGYTNRQPCIALTLNRIYGWTPDVYEQNETNVPKNIKDLTDGKHIIVKCEGENPLDKELIGPVDYKPIGFHKKFYPYKQQRGYVSPVVMMRFQKITPGVLIQVECKAYAKNIKHHRNDRAGSTHFEIIYE